MMKCFKSGSLCPEQTEDTSAVAKAAAVENDAVTAVECERAECVSDKAEARMGGSGMVEGETSNVIDKTVDLVMEDEASV